MNRGSHIEGVEIRGAVSADGADILTPEALQFVADLHRKFNSTRKQLLQARATRQKRLDQGERPSFLLETQNVRHQSWTVAAIPSDLQDRRVEITGPVEAKMMINALNSGAKVFMADFEDSLSPTWKNVIEGQLACRDAVRRTLTFKNPEGRTYRLNEKIATLVIRPRGWHLPEHNLSIDKEDASASLTDFGLYFFHNAKELIAKGTGPYFYLPKMESHLEARLWNDVFVHAQKALKIPLGTIKATVLIETILAAFEMDEILYELKEHAAGLNAGRWDYMFSVIKKFRDRPEFIFPDRSQVTMAVPFMRAYAHLLVQTCHKRGAHAIGGMAAFIPSRKDPMVNETALTKVREDKKREVGDGFDGTWVAHPDLVPIACAIFDETLGPKPHQKHKLREDVRIQAEQLLDTKITGAQITEAGVTNNINVALQYLDSWLSGVGAAAIHNLMEDAATAEISRAELWQWIRHKSQLSDGRCMDPELYKKLRDQELTKLGGVQKSHLREATEILDGLVLNQTFTEFLTIPAYKYLENQLQKGETT